MAENSIIKEVILENFMSHVYTRVPLKPGLNLICGPNGAGKSSILLGISVALGQTYTERSRRLGDLIRRGEKLGRVSIVFNNSPQDGKRPIPSIPADTVVLSRYLSRDGNYWHEINNRMVSKGEVLRLLERLSINPENMLIIMHQNMINVFGAVDPTERLRMVEEAVGLREYRERIIEAREKLSHVLSEEQSITAMLEKARETLRYWEKEYERFKRKIELERRKKELELEYAWAKVEKQEEALQSLETEISEKESELAEISREMEKLVKEDDACDRLLEKLELDFEASYNRLIECERIQARAEGRLEVLEKLGRLISDKTELRKIEKELKIGREAVEIERLKEKIAEIKRKIRETRDQGTQIKIKLAVSDLKKSILAEKLSELKSSARRTRRELEELIAEAEKVGKRIKSGRKPQDVFDELRAVNTQLAVYADISPDVEKMFMSYQQTVKDLEEKATIAEENRRKALEELELRKERWKKEIEGLLDEIRKDYLRFLERVGGTGDLFISNPEDIERAGLEISVGFRGMEPTLLDAQVHSGGERTSAIMCFLLALQRKIKSPFRAIDEFEAHLDPKNREELLRGLIEVTRDEEAQYVLITPGQITNVEGIQNVITVQKIGGVSRVEVVG
ncbi:MAG: AAA family ATPase [Candidatus Hadarchaeales archaeon]